MPESTNSAVCFVRLGSSTDHCTAQNEGRLSDIRAEVDSGPSDSSTLQLQPAKTRHSRTSDKRREHSSSDPRLARILYVRFGGGG